MKTKNVILGLCALVFAIGSAFSSVMTVNDDYIDVRYQGEEEFVCVPIGDCSGTGQFCKIIVNGTLTAQVYDLPTCVSAKKDNSPFLPGQTLQDVVEVINDETR